MSITPIASAALAQRHYMLGKLATWGAPALAVPVMRLAQDPPETRWKLFTRDFSTYSIGAGMFLLADSLASKMLKHRIAERSKRNLYALIAGVGANVLFAGLGAPRVYPLIEALKGEKPKPPETSAKQATSFGGHPPVVSNQTQQQPHGGLSRPLQHVILPVQQGKPPGLEGRVIGQA